MVERTGPKEGQAINAEFQIKNFNVTCARVVLALMPNLGDEFPKRNIGYLATMLNMHESYLSDVLGYLTDKKLISFDGVNYYVESDNIYLLDSVIARNAIVQLRKKLDVYAGTNSF